MIFAGSVEKRPAAGAAQGMRDQADLSLAAGAKTTFFKCWDRLLAEPAAWRVEAA
jgi:hypothetical protein